MGSFNATFAVALGQDKTSRQLSGMIIILGVTSILLQNVSIPEFDFANHRVFTADVGDDGTVVDDGINDANSKVNTADQQSEIDLAKEAKRNGGISADDADTLLDWANEYNVPNHGPEVHPNRPGAASNVPHIHIGPVDHILIK